MIRLKELRERKGLTQEEFGKKFRASQNTVSNWERGNRRIDNERLLEFARFFGVTIDFLLGRDGFPQRLLDTMTLRNMTSEDLARKMGVTAELVDRMITEDYEPTSRQLAQMAAILGTEVESLQGQTSSIVLAGDDETIFSKFKNVLPIKTKKIPLLGEIAAGVPVYAPEDYDAYVLADNGLHADFALRVQGESMLPNFKDKDIVFVREQPDVYDGQVAAVSIDNEATLKRVYHVRGGLQLVSYNTDYPPMLFTEENSDSLRILGLAVGLYRSV